MYDIYKLHKKIKILNILNFLCSVCVHVYIRLGQYKMTSFVCKLKAAIVFVDNDNYLTHNERIKHM